MLHGLFEDRREVAALVSREKCLVRGEQRAQLGVLRRGCERVGSQVGRLHAGHAQFADRRHSACAIVGCSASGRK